MKVLLAVFLQVQPKGVLFGRGTDSVQTSQLFLMPHLLIQVFVILSLNTGEQPRLLFVVPIKLAIKRCPKCLRILKS